MNRRYFTREAAAAWLNRPVWTRLPLADVPSGTPGVVAEMSENFPDQYALGIRWVLPHRSVPLHWCTEDEFHELVADATPQEWVRRALA